MVESLITGNIVLYSTCSQCSVLHSSKISTHVAVSPGLGIGVYAPAPTLGLDDCIGPTVLHFFGLDGCFGPTTLLLQRPA